MAAARGSSSKQRRLFGLSQELVSGAAFCVTSASMTLLNKAALSAFHFGAPTSLLCFQCTVTLLLVLAANAAGYGRRPALTLHLLRLWLPVNVLFVGMVWTSFYALANIGVAMVTVLKNLTNFLVIFGDLLLFGKRYPAGVWATLLLMLASAGASAATDLAYDGPGYAWQMANNAFTAGYSLLLRWVITRMQQQQQGGAGSTPGPQQRGQGQGGSSSPPVDELGMVVYNNLLSIPMILGLVFATGEAGRVAQEPALASRGFQLAAATSALLSFLISVASMWFLSCTTATTFSLVGSLNKIPLALLGMVLFEAPTSANNVASVTIGLAAGVVFAHAKSQSGSSGGGGSGGPSSGGADRVARQQSGQAAAHLSISMQPGSKQEQQPLLRQQ